MYSISVNEKAYLETSSNSHILFCVHTNLTSLTHNGGGNSCQHPLSSWNAAGCVLGAGQRGRVGGLCVVRVPRRAQEAQGPLYTHASRAGRLLRSLCAVPLQNCRCSLGAIWSLT